MGANFSESPANPIELQRVSSQKLAANQRPTPKIRVRAATAKSKLAMVSSSSQFNLLKTPILSWANAEANTEQRKVKQCNTTQLNVAHSETIGSVAQCD